ncbi:unnamed protein product [Schistocephalus solidus]|uniref:Reverse transcriptase domain-containing protein n=1 Tax=Schistocephalus solidus TaxID=70667 RepID=A0A183SGP6_SCHSO|nr:unnamed protein product [Schistocephalus solidus]
MDSRLLNQRRMHFHSRVSTATIHELLFADDYALNATTEEEMQRSMDLFAATCNILGHRINTGKIVVMHQPPPNTTFTTTHINFNDAQLKYVDIFRSALSTYLRRANRPDRTSSDAMQEQSENSYFYVKFCHPSFGPSPHPHPWHQFHSTFHHRDHIPILITCYPHTTATNTITVTVATALTVLAHSLIAWAFSVPCACMTAEFTVMPKTPSVSSIFHRQCYPNNREYRPPAFPDLSCPHCALNFNCTSAWSATCECTARMLVL